MNKKIWKQLLHRDKTRKGAGRNFRNSALAHTEILRDFRIPYGIRVEILVTAFVYHLQFGKEITKIANALLSFYKHFSNFVKFFANNSSFLLIILLIIQIKKKIFAVVGSQLIMGQLCYVFFSSKFYIFDIKDFRHFHK